VVELKLCHESEQDEAGGRRKVNVELSAVAFEAQARLLAAARVGSRVELEGFMSAKSRRSKKPVLHVTGVEFVEGA
jgi:primosomal replication protein N